VVEDAIDDCIYCSCDPNYDKWTFVHDDSEAVEVNQRVLVDNVLACYSGKFLSQSRLSRVP
jgi:hypothetical protein